MQNSIPDYVLLVGVFVFKIKRKKKDLFYFSLTMNILLQNVKQEF